MQRFKPLLLLALLFNLPAAKAESCEATLQLVQQLYNNTVDHCGGNPASNCSGLLLRGTNRADPAKGQAYDVWNPSPPSVALGSTAFSYFRRDINFAAPPLGTTNGFFTTPVDYLCQGQQGAQLQCAFVSDGWSDMRTDRGCFDNTATKEVEGYCQDTQVTSGAAWLARFKANQPADGSWGATAYQKQCGFDMASGRGAAARTAAFKTFLDARRLVVASELQGNQEQREFRMHTEVRVSNPDTGKMPVLAFFSHESRGLTDALANQRDYLAKTGQYRPVITVEFPKTANDVAKFSCAPVQMSPPVAGASPGFCAAGGSSLQTASAEQAAQAAQAAQQAQAVAAAAQAGAQRCNPYIASAQWVQRDEPVYRRIWSLEVKPTACGRSIGPEQTDAFFAELYARFGRDWQWTTFDQGGVSMRRQLVCHLTVLRSSPAWYLEPVRPYVSQATAISLPSRCDPLPTDVGK